MEIAKIQVSETRAKTLWCKDMPHGIIGAKVSFEFAPEWNDLRKVVVFHGCCTKDVLYENDSVVIPAEVVADPGVHIHVGVYGTDGDGQLAIPTLWAPLGATRYGTDPSGDTSTDPQLPVWAQLQGMIGDLDELDEGAGENLVAAINEVAGTRVKAADVVMLAKGKAIAQNTDLDTVTAFDNYKCTSRTTVNTLRHCPVNTPFIMRVGSPAPGVTNYFYQEMITLTGVRYYRYGQPSDNVLKWNNWRQTFDTNAIIPARFGGMGANISSDLGETAHLSNVQKFVDKMNETAVQLGMNNTLYKTPSGLCCVPINGNKTAYATQYNSHTTAYDMLRLMVAVRHTPTVYTAMGCELYPYFINGKAATPMPHSNLSLDVWKDWATGNGYTIRAIKGGSLDGEFSELGGNPIMNFVFIIEGSGNTYAVCVNGLVNNDYTTLRTIVHDLIGMANGGAETDAIREANSRTYPVGMAVAKLTGGCFDDDMAALENAINYNGHTVRVAASLAKVMTALVATHYMGNHECSVNYDDLVGGSSPSGFKQGDTTSTIDALNLALAVSDNTMATMLARVCGEQLTVGTAGEGTDGKDGFSPIVEVTQTASGATISITDQNGTTIATIVNGKDGQDGDKGDKGDKGDTGATGPQGPAGADGLAGQRGTGILNTTTGIAAYTTAVGGVSPKYRILLSTLKTQSQVNEVLVGDSVRYSTFLYPVIYVDSEYAYMTTRVNLQGTAGSAGKNGTDGKDGADGYTPVKGVDYWTAADQEAIVQQVIAALGTPVFGTVDAQNNIILTGALAEGTYTLKYEDAEGNQTTIGTLNAEGVPTYTNLIPLAINADGTLYNGGQGWKTGYRLNSSGTETAQSGIEVSGFIPVTESDTLYFKNIEMVNDATNADKYYITIYDASFTKLASLNLANTKTHKNGVTYDENNNVSMVAIGTFATYYTKTNTAYVRISAEVINGDSIITKNEPIE